MRPASPDAPTIANADPAGPTAALVYDATAGYDYPAIGYDATTYTPGAPAMKPA